MLAPPGALCTSDSRHDLVHSRSLFRARWVTGSALSYLRCKVVIMLDLGLLNCRNCTEHKILMHIKEYKKQIFQNCLVYKARPNIAGEVTWRQSGSSEPLLGSTKCTGSEIMIKGARCT